MVLLSNNIIREVKGITNSEKKEILNFFQGSVYSRCQSHPNDWFSLRDLMGGNNFDWNGTPLFALYQKHITNGFSDKQAIEKAGKEAGWLLKKVISDDNRNFETEIKDMIRNYRWNK